MSDLQRYDILINRIRTVNPTQQFVYPNHQEILNAIRAHSEDLYAEAVVAKNEMFSEGILVGLAHDKTDTVTTGEEGVEYAD